MKNTLAILSLATLLFACGGSGSQSSEQATGESKISEEALVDSISTKIDVIKSELSTQTKETVQEIDSLLNDI